jgi:hypothetical protein
MPNRPPLPNLTLQRPRRAAVPRVDRAAYLDCLFIDDLARAAEPTG